MKKGDNMRSIVSVVGLDRVGIIASVCNLLAKENVNVLDINQTILDEFFNMIMIVDLENSKKDFNELSSMLDNLSKELGVKIQIQHESIFRSMHRI